MVAYDFYFEIKDIDVYSNIKLHDVYTVKIQTQDNIVLQEYQCTVVKMADYEQVIFLKKIVD